MLNIKIRGLFVSFLLILNLTAFPKDCPSRLYNNLNQFGESDFFYGLELKGYYYNTFEDSFFFYASTLALTYEGENTVYNFELRYDPKKFARHTEGTERSPFKLRMFNVEHSFSRKFSATAGRQEISIGNGLVLDDFFDGISVHLGKRKRLNAGIGIYSIYSAKEALMCQKGFFYNYTNSWKELRQFEWGDIKSAYLNYSFRIKRNTLGFILMRTQNSADSNFNSNILSIYSKLKLFGKWKLYTETALQYFDDNRDFAYGTNLEFFKNFRFKSIGNLLIKFKYLFGSSNDGEFFAPLFGNVYIGERQHYSVRQGHILGSEIKLKTSFFKSGTFKLGYFANFREGETKSDEFDFGFELDLTKSKKIRLITSYSVWSGVSDGNQIMTNLRIIL